MATDIDDAIREARDTTEGGPFGRFLEAIAERVGAHASVTAVFGEPVERGGLTVIPVASVRWGFGGGGGTSGGEEEAGGSGGGGGVAADPSGYIEIRDGEATFRRIGPAYPSAPFILAVGLAAAFVIRAISRIARG
jgi:uncharacterized spore protein YtfJ